MLRPYQQDIINRSYEQLAALSMTGQRRRIMVQAPTGAGKSVLIGSIINLIDSYNKGACLTVAHKQELIMQLADTLQKFSGIDRYNCGIILSGVASNSAA